MRSVFVGSNGIRAGWRLLIFVAVMTLSLLVMVALGLVVVYFASHRSAREVITDVLRAAPSPNVVIISSALTLAATLIATASMARIERRPLSVYGLPIARASGRNFAEGCAAGFVALSLTLTAMYAAGDLRIAGLRESGLGLVSDAVTWAAAFAIVGLSEEYLFRGYALFTLTTGTRFVFAAILSSLAFALLHASNPGETPAGLLTVIVFALVMCGALWRTGNLWFGVGFHSAWDWGETYFYGTPDSGLVSSHALLATTVQGPAWLSGSTVGPEGSVFAIGALIFSALYIWFRFTGRPYPWPAHAAA